ncbi:hypothetical protein FA13DRAFT_1725442 [Coprinellus micaceus]|uniref:Uncharacterized protein n=1 Tax=Coprinellus micaceus TaxID=71717 RepID=A0A4Y7TUE2_COPMI|nr:hypothetical protein FA13DRAFT_1725442 [Coprinellus micaceus]
MADDRYQRLQAENAELKRQREELRQLKRGYKDEAERLKAEVEMLRGGARKAQTEGVGLEDATRWKAEARRLEEELRKAKEVRGPVGSVLVPPSTDDFLDAIRAQSAEIERLKETIRQSPSKNPAAEPKQVKQLLNTSRKQQAEIAKLKQELKAVDESKRALE